MFGDIDDVSVKAPGFDDPNTSISLHVSASWVRQNVMHARIQPLFDFWTLIKGSPPPINCIGHHEGYIVPELPGLSASHALFSGLQRPLDDSEDGAEIYVFLSCPSLLYRHVRDRVCMAKLRPAPKNAIFACYADRYQQETNDGYSGRILAWEWIKADTDRADLPKDWQERYRTERWRK